MIVALLLCLFGCNDRVEKDLRDRVAQSIKDYERFKMPYSYSEMILEALRSATPQQLQKGATLVHATLVDGHLVTHWLEDVPKVAQVKIVAKSGGFELVVPISEDYLQENLLVAKVHVVFRFCHVFDEVSCRSLTKAMEGGDLRVIVVRGDGTPSNAVPLRWLTKSPRARGQ
jgi:hypothetical protein